MLEAGERSRVVCGDCLEVLRGFPDACIDAVVTDPPYGLSFMGHAWDHGVPSADVWRECLRVLKPGGHLVAFFGTRTYHRGACAVEDAGFEVRDQLAWCYGSGFPKSLAVDKAIDRQRHDRAEVLEVTAWVRAARDARGIGNAEIDAAFGFNGMAGHWCSAESQPSVPTLEQVPRLLEVLGVGEGERRPGDQGGASSGEGEQASRRPGEQASSGEGEQARERLAAVPERIRTLLWELNGRKGQPGAAWFAREAVGEAYRVPNAEVCRPGFVGIGEVQRRPGDQATRRAGEQATSGGKTRQYQPTAPGSAEAAPWKGWGTALKPAWEPIVLARKPLAGTVADNVLAHGCGGLNIDGCRVGREQATSGEGDQATSAERGGRWPANLVHDGSAEVVGMFPNEAGAGGQASGPSLRGVSTSNARGTFNGLPDGVAPAFHGDSGSAARFFYSAKASAAERDEGLEGLEVRRVAGMNAMGDDPAGEIDEVSARFTTAKRNTHPTVKPTDLMRWLCRLVTPPGGIVLDPYTGSGSTGRGALLEGFRFVGIEKEPGYVDLARRRIAGAVERFALFAQDEKSSTQRTQSGTEIRQEEGAGLFGG